MENKLYRDDSGFPYRCEECGRGFAEPVVRRTRQEHGEFTETLYEWFCPYCGSGYVKEKEWD